MNRMNLSTSAPTQTDFAPVALPGSVVWVTRFDKIYDHAIAIFVLHPPGPWHSSAGARLRLKELPMPDLDLIKQGKQGERFPCSKPQIEFANELVVVELVGGAAFEGDLAVDDDVAAVGNADGLDEVLLRHQHRQLVTVLQFLDLLDRALDENRGETDRRLVDQEDLGRRHQRARQGQHLLLAAAEAAGQLATPLAEHRERLVRGVEILRDRRAGQRAEGAQ